MKTLKANDIPPRFRFILDMYGATERLIKNRNESVWDNGVMDDDGFGPYIGYLFPWNATPEGWEYWGAIADQDEPEIFRLTKEIEEREKQLKEV